MTATKSDGSPALHGPPAIATKMSSTDAEPIERVATPKANKIQLA